MKTKEKIRVEGYRATAQLEAQVEVPSIDFSWKSDPLSESQAKFAIIGDELNGRYYASLKQSLVCAPCRTRLMFRPQRDDGESHDDPD